jgi:hypothetical protein
MFFGRGEVVVTNVLSGCKKHVPGLKRVLNKWDLAALEKNPGAKAHRFYCL